MNPATIASLRDIKQAVLDRDIVALRALSSRLDDLNSQRTALVDSITTSAPTDSGIDAAIATERHRRLVGQRIASLDAAITALATQHHEAEAVVAQTFAETRALDRLG
jgi:hypothetical protein